MTHRLIVMRHAKSSWDSEAPNDHARPLSKRGRRDAPRIASRLVELEWIPQYVLSSDAIRTRETYERMLPELPDEPEVEFLPSLYHSGPQDVAASLPLVPEHVSTAMILGHNPGWESVVHWLSGQSIRMTTANAALLQVNADDWTSALGHRGAWKLVDVIRPKELD